VCPGLFGAHGVLLPPLQIHFAPDDYSASFTIWIMDDWCFEEEMEYFVVQLSVPGGAALMGEGYSAMVRIDDDDFGKGREHCLPPR
jgi:hypothetical protein